MMGPCPLLADTSLFGNAKLGWFRALTKSPRSVNPRRSLKCQVFAMDRLTSERPGPNRVFLPPTPNIPIGFPSAFFWVGVCWATVSNAAGLNQQFKVPTAQPFRQVPDLAETPGRGLANSWPACE